MSTEEWAEEADAFFGEFAEKTKTNKSARKESREAHARELEARSGISHANANTTPFCAEEVQKRIALSVLQKASTAEKGQYGRNAKAHAHGRGGHGSRPASQSVEDHNDGSETGNSTPREKGTRFCKAREALAKKDARKAARKEEAAAHAKKHGKRSRN